MKGYATYRALHHLKDSDLKIKFDRVMTYLETCEAEITGSDPALSITDNDYVSFLVVNREVLDNKLGEIEQAA